MHFVGGLLGQWAVWTSCAVELLDACRALRDHDAAASSGEVLRLMATGTCLTDANAAFFDAAHQFAGCIPGIHEVLRRQGLLAGRWCLDPHEELSPGQMAEIDRVLTRTPTWRTTVSCRSTSIAGSPSGLSSLSLWNLDC